MSYIAAEKTDLEKLEHTKCSLCQKQCSGCKILPCLHVYCKYCILKVTTTKCSCPVCYPTPLSEDDGVGKCQKVRSTTGNCPSTSDGGFCETCNSENRVEAFCQDCGVYICIQCFKSHFNNIAH